MSCCWFYMIWMESCLLWILNVSMVRANVLCYFIDWWRMPRVITIIDRYRFTNMPVLWQDDIIRTDVYYCTQKVYWKFCAENFKTLYNKEVLLWLMWHFCNVIIKVGFGVLLKVVGTTASILGGIVTCEIVLTNMCGVGNVEIWLTCKGNGAVSNTTIDQSPWCRCSWLVKNQSIPIR